LQHDPKGSGIPVAAAKTELIIHLEKIGHPDGLPASHQAESNLVIGLSSLRFEIHLMAIQVHHIEGIELSISLYVARTHQIHLVNVVHLQRLGEVGVFRTLGNIYGFF